MIIYKITNLINQKVYVGQTIHSLESRWLRHCRKSSTSAISKSIRKHDKSNFKSEILEVCNSLEHLDNRERYWISHLKSNKKLFGYNKTNGGQCGGLCEEALANMKLNVSKALKGKNKPKRSKQHSEKIAQSKLNKPNIKKRKPIKCSNGVNYDSIDHAAQSLKLSKGNIHGVIKGNRRSCGGYTFGYIL